MSIDLRPKLKHNVLIFTFLARTWLLWLLMFSSNWLTLTHHHFAILGTWELDEVRGGVWVPHTPMEAIGGILYALPVGLSIYLLYLFLIHIHYRETIDRDIHDGTYLRDWGNLTSEQRVRYSTQTRIGIFIGLCILLSGLARGGSVDEAARWKAAQIDPRRSIALDIEVSLYERTKARYQAIQAMRANGVPAPILFCLHMRESDNSFRHHAHEGSPLTGRTRDVPKGRPLRPNPPYTFEQSAEDAYYVCERPPLDQINWRDLQAALDKMESFNGFGYRARGVAAPYLWSGTTIYKGGKYIRDGVFSATAMDQQLGCAAVLKRMQARGIALSFAP